MAGTTSSGYISAFWQALFASLVQMVARIFRFTAADATSPKHQNPSSFTWSHPRSPRSPGTTQLQPSSHSPPSAEQQQHQHQHQNPQWQPEVDRLCDLEQGLSLPPHLQSQDQEMASSKKRGSQRRAGVKANGAKPAAAPAPGTSTTEGSTGQPQFHTLPHLANNSFAPLESASTADKDENQTHFQDAKSKSQRRTGRNQGRSSPTKQLLEGKKENDSILRETPEATNAPQPDTVPLDGAGLSVKSQRPEVNPLREITNDKKTTSPIVSSQNPLGNSAASTPALDSTTAAVDRLKLAETPLSDSAFTKEIAAAASGAVALPTPTIAIPDALKPLLQKTAANAVTTHSTNNLPGLIPPTTEEGKAERNYHLKYMREALAMGQLALDTNETPVGCVLVYQDRIIAKGMNATNVTRNGTRHAEFMAISALLSHTMGGDAETDSTERYQTATWGDVDPTDGHLFPYGQKLHPAPKVSRSVISDCVLYVTVEPCVMCASLLRQFGVKKVYFGAVNDKFGGTGGVFRIHLNSKPVPKPSERPYQNGYGPQDVDRIIRGRANALSRDDDDGDGGNVEPGYPVEGGYLRDEAVSLLRRFYVQENGRAPQPRKKEGRAARLFAMEAQANGASSSELSDAPLPPETPTEVELTTATGATNNITASSNASEWTPGS